MAAGEDVGGILVPRGDAPEALEELALVLRGRQLVPGEDLFVWPHPSDPYKALFVMDGAAERAMWTSASRGNEECQANLSRIRDSLVVTTELVSGTMLMMASDVLATGRVSDFALLCLIPVVSGMLIVSSKRVLIVGAHGDLDEQIEVPTASLLVVEGWHRGVPSPG